MACPGNRHRASCIGTLSFPILSWLLTLVFLSAHLLTYLATFARVSDLPTSWVYCSSVRFPLAYHSTLAYHWAACTVRRWDSRWRTTELWRTTGRPDWRRCRTLEQIWQLLVTRWPMIKLTRFQEPAILWQRRRLILRALPLSGPAWLETAIVGSHDSWVVVSRGPRVKKCDPLSSLLWSTTGRPDWRRCCTPRGHAVIASERTASSIRTRRSRATRPTNHSPYSVHTVFRWGGSLKLKSETKSSVWDLINMQNVK